MMETPSDRGDFPCSRKIVHGGSEVDGRNSARRTNDHILQCKQAVCHVGHNSGHSCYVHAESVSYDLEKSPGSKEPQSQHDPLLNGLLWVSEFYPLLLELMAGRIV
ncbi:hypothetical protein DPMN_087035 [Dreissena polymorpha]|uniref:Uncharacterized protein n=1 Tax=Dreissena polymorpha TaxID=45954 RepID=A0A9D4KS95_DREPO|nr:hypothetical protein DPMN_087035 [Dreissena polymorpha]